MLNVISKIKEATGLNVYAFAAPRVEECVVYKYTSISDDGVTERARLEVRVIAFTLAEAIEIEKAIKQSLLFKGDGSKIQGIVKIDSNGGGCLEELGSGTIHLFSNYEILKQSEVK